MSRVGKLPVDLPAGVSVTVKGDVFSVKGPKGSLERRMGRGVQIKVDGSRALVEIVGTDPQSRANYGTTRAHLRNMVKGVSEGWKRSLELSGVGFSAKLNGNNLVLSVGFSHEVTMPLPASVKCVANKTSVEMESFDKEELGSFAARVRQVQPPEPYLGKGIRYANEVVRRKAGKTGKK